MDSAYRRRTSAMSRVQDALLEYARGQAQARPSAEGRAAWKGGEGRGLGRGVGGGTGGKKREKGSGESRGEMSPDWQVAANKKHLAELRAELNRIRLERIPPEAWHVRISVGLHKAAGTAWLLGAAWERSRASLTCAPCYRAASARISGVGSTSRMPAASASLGSANACVRSRMKRARSSSAKSTEAV